MKIQNTDEIKETVRKEEYHHAFIVRDPDKECCCGGYACLGEGVWSEYDESGFDEWFGKNVSEQRVIKSLSDSLKDGFNIYYFERE